MKLVASGIEVALGRRRILQGVDLAADAGTVTAIVGPNGSGKTTLLRALVGEVKHLGTVSLNGRDIREAKPWELAGIRGVLPQASSIAFPFTVIEVVIMGLEAGPHAADRAIAAEALRRVGLQGYENRYYQELSGGEQQRTQLARVLAQIWQPVSQEGPSWLFLDEPVSSLDIAHQLAVMRLVKDYAMRGAGVVAVMHDLNLSAMFADQIVLMKSGAIEAAGPPLKVLNNQSLSEVYGCEVRVNEAPDESQVFLLPHSAQVSRHLE